MTLADGTVVEADLIIAADGAHSIAAKAITGQPMVPQPAQTNNCCYRFLIPTELLRNSPDTKWFLEGHPNDGTRIFSDIPGRRRIVTYPCRKYAVVPPALHILSRLVLPSGGSSY